MLKLNLIRGIAAAMLCVSPLAAQAESATKVNFSIFVPQTHPIYAKMIVPWAQEVERVTEGRVDVNLLPKPLGSAAQHFDLVRDGVAGAAFTIHGYTPNRFVLTKMAELPFSGDDAEAISVAYWKVHQKYFAKAGEHDGLRLLGLFVHGPGTMFVNNASPTSVEDLQGIKFRVGGGIVNDVANALGMTAVLKPAPQSYELLSNGVVDGILFPISSIKSFRLAPFVPHAVTFPGGLYNTSFMLGMNEDMFDSLSEADQAAILSVSGESFAKMAGRAWDEDTDVATKEYIAGGGEIVAASDAFLAQVHERVDPIENSWIEAANALNVDGEAALAEFRELIAAYQRSE